MPVVAVVEMLATYLLVDVADSQPQVFAVAGSTVADWIVSVMDVRHAEAARMSSEAFARIV